MAAHNGRSINREYSPYAVDSLEDLSKESSSFKGSYPNNSYQNLGLARSQEDLSKKASTSKGSYQNPAYENSEMSHQYEDPAHLVAAASASTGPRRKRNELYEPTDLKPKDQEANNDDYNDEIGGDTWLSRLILFLILMVSLASLLLVVLIMLGKVGTSCSSCNEETQASAPTGAQLGGSQTTNEPSNVNVLPPDVSSLENKINELKANLSWIKTFMNTLQRDVQGTKGDLTDTNRNINGTKDKLSQIESGTQASISMIQNISQRLNASVSAINVSFFQELSSVKTSFDSKLNNTAQNLLDADNSLQTLLNTINSSLSSQVQSISKLQGPTGPTGFDGSKGDEGPQGGIGTQGNQGDQGDKGDPGVKGDRGVNGTDGAPGQKGNTGPQGDKGDAGAAGSQGGKGEIGPQGLQGAGNFSQCMYKEFQGTVVSPGNQGPPGIGVVADAAIIETQDKKILGASCSTNKAAEYNLQRTVLGSGENKFICTCNGLSSLFNPSGSVWCKVHYWECPLTT